MAEKEVSTSGELATTAGYKLNSADCLCVSEGLPDLLKAHVESYRRIRRLTSWDAKQTRHSPSVSLNAYVSFPKPQKLQEVLVIRRVFHHCDGSEDRAAPITRGETGPPQAVRRQLLPRKGPAGYRL